MIKRNGKPETKKSISILQFMTQIKFPMKAILEDIKVPDRVGKMLS